MTDEPTIEDRLKALEIMVQQQYKVLAIIRDGMEGLNAADQLARNMIEQLADAGSAVARDITNLAELVKIQDRRITRVQNWMEN